MVVYSRILYPPNNQYNNNQNQYGNNYGNNGNNYGNNNGNQCRNNEPQPSIQQSQNNNYGNDNNKNKSEFGVQLPKSVYHPISVKNVFNAKGAGNKFPIPPNHGHVYDQYKYSHSPQPPTSQSYSLQPNQNNNYPSNSAPPPNINQMNNIQQQIIIKTITITTNHLRLE